MANYYGSLFKSNGTSSTAPTRWDATLPACTDRGVPRYAVGTLTLTAATSSSDSVFLARAPAGHRVSRIRFRCPADMDSGNNVTVNIGTQAAGSTYDDADAYAAASTLFQAGLLFEYPSNGDVTKDAPSTWYTGPGGNGTPDVDYDIVLTFAANGWTTTSGVVYYEIEYGADPTVLDDYSAPAVVAGTQ